MSEHLSFDRKKGFVALPVEVLDIDLSPGAFRTLVELCRMANPDGYCWPSLGQLSARMGRSKAAISGYLKDLRAAELISTEEQQTANGYNYRLKYRVTFWQAWRASLSGATTATAERRVQQDERLRDSKNQSHENQVQQISDSDLDSLLSQWARCFRGAPYPTARSEPSPALISTTHAYLATAETKTPDISADIHPKLTALWSDLNLSPGDRDLLEQLAILQDAGFSGAECAAICAHILKTWPDYWTRNPTADQFKKLVKASGVTAHRNKLSLLESHLKRWTIAEKHLRSGRPSCSLTQGKEPAAMARQTQKYPWI